MSLAELSIKRPVFITCLVILFIAIGWISLRKMPVNLFPDVAFPVVMVNTAYPGAGPEEIASLVSKPLEDQLSTIPGIKRLGSQNVEGSSHIHIEFESGTDIKYAEQQVRDKVSSARPKLPSDIKEPVIKRIDPSDQAIVILALKSKLSGLQAYEIADKNIRSKLEQVSQVGMVEILGGHTREIRVELDRKKLEKYDISATTVANRIATAGQNLPAGKVEQGQSEKVFRTLGQFKSIDDIGSVVINFFGNEVPVTVKSLGRIVDTWADESSKTYVNGKPSLLLMVYRQSGANTIAVADAIKKKVQKINSELKDANLLAQLEVVRDDSNAIRVNVADVEESIMVGILLTIIVVFLFLGSLRSTFITALALPTSLIGSFFLMYLAGFSINTMSLLALSLAVGLLIDDAIVVRENIFRYNEQGKDSIQAAILGTKEVLLAVVAASLCVIAVFVPIGFLKGVVGGFFKEFGLTVSFAMAISLFEAITVAPMLSAYIGNHRTHQGSRSRLWDKSVGRILQLFNKLQNNLEVVYEKILRWTLRFPIITLLSAVLIFVLSIVAIKYVPKTFVPSSDNGEFMVSLELPPGMNLQTTNTITQEIDTTLRSNAEIATSVAIVGGMRGDSNAAVFFVTMVPSSQRTVTTTEFKQHVRQQVRKFTTGKIVIKDIDVIGGGQRPFNLNITGADAEQLKVVAFKAYEILKKYRGLTDPEISYKPGKPEMQIIPDKARVQALGISPTSLGQELRTQVEGSVPAVFRENGEEYDIRVRLQDDQRDLEKDFAQILVPNMNNALVRLSDVAKPLLSQGPTTITRQNRLPYIQISGDIAPDGPGMGGVMQDIHKMFREQIKLPAGISYKFTGQAENFSELNSNMVTAIGFGILFIYLVLASLYESFIIPFTIMLVFPLAACGAFFALALTQHSLDIFSMIGCVLLFGIATKNSILLVDYTQQLIAQGLSRHEAIVKAGRTRLRPILMTTIALIAGTLPVAIGLNEASRQRTSMGVAVIGGLISSTVLTLVVVPAAYSYIERFREWSIRLIKKLIQSKNYQPVHPVVNKQELPVGNECPELE
jgi:HAE1 family hydrophobic/amphiphilic exporter-1